MANSFSGKLFGGKYKKTLHFVPCGADKEKTKVGHEISEHAIFRFLLNEETLEKFDEAAEVEIPQMLDVLKDIDKQSKITQVEAYRSSMMKATDAVKAYHVFIVFKTTSERVDDAGDYWWSLEKNTEYIVLQRSCNKENVKDKLVGEERNKVKLIEKDLKGKGTIQDLFAILWAHQIIPENYNILNSNCQFLVTFVGEQITEIGYKYKGNFKYYPPPEKGRDKQMLDLINVIRGCSDWPPLFHLIKMGNTDLVDKIVASGKYDINASCNGLTPLHLAIRLEKIKMIKHLLQHPAMNADPTKRDERGRNALHVAADMFKMNAEIIDLLLAHDKVNVDDVDENGQTALHLAASDVNIFQKLLENGANPNIFNKWGQSPLYDAVQQSDRNDIMDLVLLLAHSKVKVDDVNKHGQTALHIAAFASNVVAVQKLLERGATPNITDKNHLSPLHWAAQQRDGIPVIDLLLAHPKVNVDDVTENGVTALHWAVFRSNVMVVKHLIDKGADPNIFDKYGRSPLHAAAQERDGIPIIDLLLEAQKVKGIGDVNDQIKQGRTALHYAAAHSNEITAEHLINKGANVNHRANVGLTPLDMAALGAKDTKIIDLLLENINEADIGQYRNDERLFFFARHNMYGLGNTILDRLVKKSIHTPCTETDDCITGESDDEATGVNTRRFVEKGADPSIDLMGFDGFHFLIARVKISLGIYDDINGRDQNGETLLLVAILGNNVDWVRYLLEKGADPTIPDEDGFTPFHVAVKNNTYCDILNLLLNSGKVDINETTSKYGWTALHLAVRDSNTATAEFLLSSGADPNVTDKDGSSPLHVAAEYAKDMDIVELLINHEDVDVNCLDNAGHSALYHTKWNYHGHGERIANLLREKGAMKRKNRLPKRNKGSLEKLMRTLSHQKTDEIENLLSDNTKTMEDKISKFFEEHLISAIKDSDVESVSVLLKNGADISSARGETGMNALHWASYWAKTTDLIDVILETEKFDINGVDNEGWTPLYWAIMGTNCETNARHLIGKGADPTILGDSNGETPFHMVAEFHTKTEVLGLMLGNEIKIDIDERNKEGETALHIAITKSNVIAARFLLLKGANPNIADKKGITPLHLAAKNAETTELIDIILETGQFDINGVDNDGRTPLFYAIERPKPITINVRRLIEMGADPGIADNNGVTPLHMAAKNAESMDLIELLLNTEAVDVNCVDNQGRTPFAYAQDNKHGLGQRIIDRLKEYGA